MLMKSSALVGVVGAGEERHQYMCWWMTMDSMLTVGAVQVSETENIGGTTLDVAVCAAADESSLAS
jgi:hypothetical protein